MNAAARPATEPAQESNDPMMITVETSCGQTFQRAVTDIADEQLQGLLAQNGDRTDVDPSQLAAIGAELERRRA